MIEFGTDKSDSLTLRSDSLTLVSLYQWASLVHQNERDQIFSIAERQNRDLLFE